MSKNLYILIISGMLSILSASGAFAQRLAVKSNLLADALASPNIEVELLVSTSGHWTLRHIISRLLPVITVVGNTGFCNPKPVAGCVLLLQVIFWVSMLWVDVSM